jgi:replicative DNA helicase
MEDKIPPHDLEAELCVLGSMMISKEAIAQVVGKLKPSYFYRDANAQVFKAILALFQKNEPVDLVTVGNELKKNKVLAEIGSKSYLVEMLEAVPTASNIDYYSDIVVEKAILRKMIDIGSDIVTQSFDSTKEADEVVDNAQKKIMDVSKEKIKDSFVPIKDILMPVMNNIEKVYDQEDNLLGVPTGLKDFDAITSGLQKSDLIIIAARPAMGKTTLAMNIAMNAAILHKIPVAIFSLEMPKEQIALKMLSAEAKIDSNRLKSANIQEHEYKFLSNALGRLSETPIYIDDKPSLSPLEFRAKCRRLQAEVDLKLVIVDYLQLMKSHKTRVESRFQEVSEIVRELKACARELNIPVIALSQLSRDIEKRQDPLPRLSDLRESGEIEQTADLVLFIHREDYYEQSKDHTSMAKLVIAKHRNGPTGAVEVMFKKDISKFYSSDKRYATAQP